MPSAFISHSSKDDGYVAELESFVRNLGFTTVFNDVHIIAAGDEFWPRIVEGITSCEVFIIVLSRHSVKSRWVDDETELAISLGKTITPIRIDDCAIPDSLKKRNVRDLRPGRGERVKIAPSRILRHSPPKLFGREAWLDALDDAWNAEGAVNVFTLVAWGGVGKTSLVAHWIANRLAAKGWPGVERYFDWSFYSQGTGESRQTSSDLFIHEALKFFDDPDPLLGSPWERGERLAGLIRRRRTLLVLDGIEPLQYPIGDPQAGRLKDQGLEALVIGLAQDNPGLCVITTREHLKNVESFGQAKEQKLDKLLKEAAVALLRHLQVVGSDDELAAAWKDAGGHALTLHLLGRFLADAHGGDVRLRSEVDFEEMDAEHQGRSAFKVMIAYERWLQSAGPTHQRELAILRLTGLFDRPISPDCLQALRAAPVITGLTDALADLKDAAWNIAMNRLLEIDLVSQPDNDTARNKYQPKLPVDAHPLIREYFAKQLKETQPAAFQAAHARLFDHLCKNTPHRPDTLDGLAPLYQAVVHGCLAGRHPEAREKVFRDRILRGEEVYSAKKLGAIGADLAAVAAFFEQPWNQLATNLTEPAQAWLLATAAFDLRALGRLTEALEPMRAGLEMAIQREDWKNAAIASSNLSELEVALGRLPEAVSDGRRSVDFADRSGDAFEKMSKRTTAADALRQSGEPVEARAFFEEAEKQQCERQPEYELLYSVQGFRYCDLLLAPAERAAWRKLLGQKKRAAKDVTAALVEVERRATTTLSWATTHNLLLTIALDHLTLARVGVYRVVLKTSRFPLAASKSGPEAEVAAAVNSFRQAGTQHYLPAGLLTAALLQHVTGDAEGARRSLAEAEQIAERGPMPLFLADVHLHRARLLRDRAALAQAAAMIRAHGYGRRDEELADAEAASKGW